jgi:hypothetical protein
VTISLPKSIDSIRKTRDSALHKTTSHGDRRQRRPTAVHFTGKLDKLTIKLEPQKMSAEDQKAKGDAIARAND